MTKIAELFHKWFLQSQQISPVRIAKLDRKRLMITLGEQGLRKGAEIGVDRGTFSDYMMKNIPDLEMIGVDPFLREPKRLEEACNKLNKYQDKYRLVHDISMNAYRDVPDESLDFIYIDGDHHFDFVMTDLIEWARKVKPGGVISGHDYYRFRQAGVIAAVDAYTKMHNIQEWFLTDEKTPTWFWAKPMKPQW